MVPPVDAEVSKATLFLINADETMHRSKDTLWPNGIRPRNPSPPKGSIIHVNLLDEDRVLRGNQTIPCYFEEVAERQKQEKTMSEECEDILKVCATITSIHQYMTRKMWK